MPSGQRCVTLTQSLKGDVHSVYKEFFAVFRGGWDKTEQLLTRNLLKASPYCPEETESSFVSTFSGWMEFKLCPVNNPSVKANQACFDRYVLPIVDQNGNPRISQYGATRTPVSTATQSSQTKWSHLVSLITWTKNLCAVTIIEKETAMCTLHPRSL